MSKPNGYFEAYVNQQAYHMTPADRALMGSATGVVAGVLPGSRIHWAGSQRKGTAIVGSDLDLCVDTNVPVTEAQRRSLRGALEQGLRRPATVLSHAIRLPAQVGHPGHPKVDIAFANAAFGSRPLPDPAPFHNRRSRQATARAIKCWSRNGGLPPLPGWVVEALVVHLDVGKAEHAPMDLFLRVIEWLSERATPGAIEGVLRPAAFPRWDPRWSGNLPGQLEAIRNHARALLKKTKPESWLSANDVGRWLGR